MARTISPHNDRKIENRCEKEDEIKQANVRDLHVLRHLRLRFSAAASNADWQSEPGFGLILTDQPGAASWPITAATFILIHKQPKDPAAAAEALKFFDWAFTNGGKMAEELDFIPMPANVVTAIRKVWSEGIKDASGKPIFYVLISTKGKGAAGARPSPPINV
jgi:phosphate transport system substrate-binding protein